MKFTKEVTLNGIRQQVIVEWSHNPLTNATNFTVNDFKEDIGHLLPPDELKTISARVNGEAMALPIETLMDLTAQLFKDNENTRKDSNTLMA